MTELRPFATGKTGKTGIVHIILAELAGKEDPVEPQPSPAFLTVKYCAGLAFNRKVGPDFSVKS